MECVLDYYYKSPLELHPRFVDKLLGSFVELFLEPLQNYNRVLGDKLREIGVGLLLKPLYNRTPCLGDTFLGISVGVFLEPLLELQPRFQENHLELV